MISSYVLRFFTLIVLRAFARKTLRFESVIGHGWFLNRFRACFRSIIAFLHSSLNHGLRSIRGSFDVFGIVCSAIDKSMFV